MRSLTVRLARDTTAPRRARRALDEAVGDRATDLDTARLLLSELVTNSVRHASGERMEVEFEVDSAVLTVRVRDGGPGLDPDGDGVTMPPPDAGGGRGLPLVAALADRWGARRAPAEVWFSQAI